jgi:RNA polymerase-binding transcription factor DksA
MDEKQMELADALTNSIIEGAISKARLTQVRPKNYEGFCECGAEVPQRRVDAGYFNCLFCQEHIEHRKKYYGGR